MLWPFRPEEEEVEIMEKSGDEGLGVFWGEGN